MGHPAPKTQKGPRSFLYVCFWSALRMGHGPWAVQHQKHKNDLGHFFMFDSKVPCIWAMTHGPSSTKNTKMTAVIFLCFFFKCCAYGPWPMGRPAMIGRIIFVRSIESDWSDWLDLDCSDRIGDVTQAKLQHIIKRKWTFYNRTLYCTSPPILPSQRPARGVCQRRRRKYHFQPPCNSRGGAWSHQPLWNSLWKQHQLKDTSLARPTGLERVATQVWKNQTSLNKQYSIIDNH